MASCNECGRNLEHQELSSGATDQAPRADDAEPDDADAETCPGCGAPLHEEPEADGEEDEAPAKAPWHFKFLVVGTVIYLGYRLYQGIEWLLHHA